MMGCSRRELVETPPYSSQGHLPRPSFNSNELIALFLVAQSNTGLIMKTEEGEALPRLLDAAREKRKGK